MVHRRHTNANAIGFLDDVVKSFPFRVCEIRMDNGHEFQGKNYSQVENESIRHAYIKRRFAKFYGKSECSHRTDEEGFYQLLTFKEDVYLDEKPAHCGSLYNLSRSHGAFNGKAPC